MKKGHEITTNTSLALQSLYGSAQTHFHDMTANQREAWERVGAQADEIGSTLATVNADLPDILNVLQTILDHFQQSSQNLSTLHAELEAKIENNNNNLILQEHLIKRLGMTGGFDFVQSIILAGAGIVIVRSINSWAAISVFSTLSECSLSYSLSQSLTSHSHVASLPSLLCHPLRPYGSNSDHVAFTFRICSRYSSPNRLPHGIWGRTLRCYGLYGEATKSSHGYQISPNHTS
jgi:hypothetical protein